MSLNVIGIIANQFQVTYNLAALRQNATILDELDVSCSFATLAIERRLVRPSLHTG